MSCPPDGFQSQTHRAATEGQRQLYHHNHPSPSSPRSPSPPSPPSSSAAVHNSSTMEATATTASSYRRISRKRYHRNNNNNNNSNSSPPRGTAASLAAHLMMRPTHVFYLAVIPTVLILTITCLIMVASNVDPTDEYHLNRPHLLVSSSSSLADASSSSSFGSASTAKSSRSMTESGGETLLTPQEREQLRKVRREQLRSQMSQEKKRNAALAAFQEPKTTASSDPAKDVDSSSSTILDADATILDENDSVSSSSSFTFDYQQPAVRTSFTLPDPHYFAHDKMIILVLSARNHFVQRQTVRETWGANHSVYFVIGGPQVQESLQPLEQSPPSDDATTSNGKKRRKLSKSNQTSAEVLTTTTAQSERRKTRRRRLKLLEPPTIQSKLLDEQRHFRDLLDSIHPDSYQSLPYKVHFAYRWITQHLPHVEWLVKVDDDTVVRVDTLYRVLLRNLNPNHLMVVGRIIEQSAVAREGKWAELKYKPEFYPYWPQGSCGHVVSRAVARYLGNRTDLVYYQGEDTSIGIWLDEAVQTSSPKNTGITSQNDNGEDIEVSWIHSAYFSNDGKCLDHAWLIMGHEVSPEKMRECHQHADEWHIEDVKHKHRNYWFVETLKQKKYSHEGSMWWGGGDDGRSEGRSKYDDEYSSSSSSYYNRMRDDDASGADNRGDGGDEESTNFWDWF